MTGSCPHDTDRSDSQFDRHLDASPEAPTAIHCTDAPALTGRPPAALVLLLSVTLALSSVHCGGGGGGGGTPTPPTVPPTTPPGLPDTTITTIVPTVTNASAIDVEFSSDDASATFEARLDNGAWSTVVSPAMLSALTEGDHTFEVRAINSAGVDPSPAAVTWNIDLTAPTTTLDTTPAVFSNETEFSFEFSSDDAAATFEGRVDGGVFQPITSPFLATGLTAGAHLFEIRATDAVGNTETPAQQVSWEVDLTPPLVPTLTQAQIDPTQTGVVNLEWTPSADAESGLSEYRIYTASTAVPVVVDGSATATDIGFSAPCGTFQLTITAVDQAGNESAPSTQTELTLNDCGPDGTFADAEFISLTGTPRTCVLHDFNEDGGLDLVVGGTDRISVLLAETIAGVPTGNFVNPVTPVPGSYPVAAESLIHGDWNADSIEDLAAVGNGSLTILLGNGADGRGNGTFSIGNIISIASFFATGTLRSGDFNEDRISDLAIAGSGGVLVFSGNGSNGRGDGTFTQTSSSATGSARDLGVVDFDADGILDLTVADYFLTRVCLYGGSGTDAIGVGTFGFQGCLETGVAEFVPPPPGTPTPAGGPVALLWEDLNEDFIIDLVVASTTLQGSGYVSLLFGIPDASGNASGTFAPYQTILEGSPVADLASGDFNGDGVVDLVAVNDTELALLIGLGINGIGSGTFDAPILIPTTADPTQVTVSDFDGNGTADLVAVVEGGIDLIRGGGGFATPSGSFSAFEVAAVAGNDTHRLVVNDFNEDEILDLGLANAELTTTAPPLRQLGIGLGTSSSGVPDGSFTLQPLQIPDDFIPAHIVSSDLNSDGIVDLLLVSASGELLVAFGTGASGVGDGSFMVGPLTLLTQNVDALTLCDFNRDDILDVVVLGSNSLIVYPGNGSDGRDVGSWGGALVTASTGGTELAQGDFNGDGIIDFVVNDGSLFLGTELAELEPLTPLDPPSQDWNGEQLACADFDGDGITDILAAGANLSLYLGNGSNGQGDTTFQLSTPVPLGTPTVDMLLLHLDRDGSSDVALLHTQGVQLLRYTSSAIPFVPLQELPLVDPGSAMERGDFNGDGVADVVVVQPLCCSDAGVSTVSIAFGIGTPPIISLLP